MPWECPRCGRINAPTTAHCDCQPEPMPRGLRPIDGATTGHMSLCSLCGQWFGFGNVHTCHIARTLIVKTYPATSSATPGKVGT